MRKIILMASALALSTMAIPSSWSADLVVRSDVKSGHPRNIWHHNSRFHPKGSAPWNSPRNAPLITSARYCEDRACETVTLQIWSGDTLGMHRLGQHHERIRIANIQAANVHGRCPAEVEIAQDAKLQLMSILTNSTFVLARIAGTTDKTSTAFITANGRDVGKTMIDRHSARPFETPVRPWC